MPVDKKDKKEKKEGKRDADDRSRSDERRKLERRSSGAEASEPEPTMRDMMKILTTINSNVSDVRSRVTQLETKSAKIDTIDASVADLTNKFKDMEARVNSVEDAQSAAKAAVKSEAVDAFEKYHTMPKGSATVEQVQKSTAGIRGWRIYAEQKQSAVPIPTAVPASSSNANAGNNRTNGLTAFQANSLVIGGWPRNTHASVRLAEAEKILEKLVQSNKHFRKPVSEFLHSSIVRVPLRPDAPRAAINMAAEEYKVCGYAPMVSHPDGTDKVLWCQGPMSPARRNRNQTLHRGLAYFKANHPQLNAEICFGSGRICFGESGTSTLVKVSYESVPTYYATLRTHNVDKDKLNDAISNSVPSSEAEALF